MSMLASWTADMWSPIINLFSFIPSFGFMIIVFTIFLKLVLSPLDVWQRKVSRDSMKKQSKLQPELDKLKKSCGNNQQLLNQKTMQLYKREGYNVVGSCFSMLINMVLTIFIFFTLFSALMEISQNNTYDQYKELDMVYQQTIVSELGATDFEGAQVILDGYVAANLDEARTYLVDEKKIENPTEIQIKQQAFAMVAEDELKDEFDAVQAAVALKYEEIKDSWLWVDNIWRPDTYVSGFPNFADFNGMANVNGHLPGDKNKGNREYIQMTYDVITADVQGSYSSWNGYFILVVLSGVVTYLSLRITQGSSKKKQTAFKPVNNSVKQINPQANTAQNANGAMGIMKFIMPVVMIIFTFSYSAAFALYIVTNSAMATIISFVSMKIFDKMDKNKELKNKDNKKIEYSR